MLGLVLGYLILWLSIYYSSFFTRHGDDIFGKDSIIIGHYQKRESKEAVVWMKPLLNNYKN